MVSKHQALLDMRPRWVRTRLFISYAREDSKAATEIYRSLVAADFEVYLDTEGTLTGERFDTVIVQQLRRADGLGGHLKTGHGSTLQNRPPRAWRPRP
jgi:hypothetical protein